jgi:hypothetical protein
MLDTHRMYADECTKSERLEAELATLKEAARWIPIAEFDMNNFDKDYWFTDGIDYERGALSVDITNDDTYEWTTYFEPTHFMRITPLPLAPVMED